MNTHHPQGDHCAKEKLHGSAWILDHADDCDLSVTVICCRQYIDRARKEGRLAIAV